MVSASGVLERILESKRDEIIEDFKNVHNEELHKIYTSTNIVRLIKSWRIRWAGHLACTEEKCVQKTLS
jgi:hypothetical protein